MHDQKVSKSEITRSPELTLLLRSTSIFSLKLPEFEHESVGNEEKHCLEGPYHIPPPSSISPRLHLPPPQKLYFLQSLLQSLSVLLVVLHAASFSCRASV